MSRRKPHLGRTGIQCEPIAGHGDHVSGPGRHLTDPVTGALIAFECDPLPTVDASLDPADARRVDGDVEPLVAPRITIHRHMMPENRLRSAKQATSQTLR
jgi:hypothetical protein